MRTRAAARRAPWPELPAPLWEAICGLLPASDVLALRQAWRGAARLGDMRVRAAVVAQLTAELDDCVLMIRGAAVGTQQDALPGMEQQFGYAYVEIDFLSGFLEGAMGAALGNHRATRCLMRRPLRTGCSGLRVTFELQPRGTGIVMQAVLLLTESHDGEAEDVEVGVEEVRFLTQGGALLAEYGLAWALDNSRCSVRSVRLADTGFGRLQARPMSEAAPHFEALVAAAAGQPLREADGRWADGLLWPAIHASVTGMYPPQLS